MPGFFDLCLATFCVLTIAGKLSMFEICFSLQVYLEVGPSGSQLVEKAMKAMNGVGGAACTNPT